MHEIISDGKNLIFKIKKKNLLCKQREKTNI